MITAATQSTEIGLPDAAALALWPIVLAIGLVGFVVPYQRPAVPRPPEVPIAAQQLNIELTRDPLPDPALNLPAEATPPSLALPPLPATSAPALTSVAEPSTVAFALPVEGPTQVVPAKQAAFAAPLPRVTDAPLVANPAPRQLVFGQGEGRQPAPDYPYRARREGQEGVVKVRFSVGESGQVLSAEALGASPWPLLNDAAVRTVRERWRFSSGTLRLFEVSIRFQLDR